MTVTVTKETDVEMLQKIFPEESPDISTFERVLCSCRMEHIKDGYGVVQRSLSRETDLAEVRIHWPPHSPDSPLTFLSLGLYER